MLHSEHVGSDLFQWAPAVTNELLYASYLQWCQANRHRRPKTKAVLGKHLAQYWRPKYKMPDGSIIGEARFDATDHEGQIGHLIKSPVTKNGFLLGSLDEAKQRFADVRRLSLDDLGF